MAESYPEQIEILRKFGIINEAKKLLKPYPEMDADMAEALKREEAILLSEWDLVFLLKHQNKLCDKCGKCCRTQSPILVTQADLARMADYLHMPYKKLKKKLKLIPRKDGGFFLEGKPCPFLKGNKCSIYEARPLVCRTYPANYIITSATNGKTPKIDFECGVIRKLFAWKIATTTVMIRLEKENPELLEAMRSEAQKLWNVFMPNEKEMEKMPLEEQLVYLNKWTNIFQQIFGKI